MNAELEALLRALDAVLQSRDSANTERLEAIYQSRLDDVLHRSPGLSREQLQRAVDRAYHRWVKADRKFPTLPPQA